MNRSKSSYRDHSYSGPKSSQKQVRAQMKRFYGDDVSREDAWRKKTKPNLPSSSSKSTPLTVRTYVRKTRPILVKAEADYNIPPPQQISPEKVQEVNVNWPITDPTLDSHQRTIESISQQVLEQSATQNKLSTMEQLDIKVEPETHNDDTPHVHNMQQDTFLTCDRKIKYESMLHHTVFIKDDPDSDNRCSELIDDTQVMCASTSQSSDGVAMHIKEEPAADVVHDESPPLPVIQLMVAQIKRSHSLLPVPQNDELKDSVTHLKISSIQSVHKQQVVPSGLSTDDVCVSDTDNSDCTRQVNLKEHAKCTASGNTYQCDVCRKCFSQKSDLQSHIRTHNVIMERFCKNNITPVGTNISSQARIAINNVYKFLTEIKEDPEILKSINFARPRDLTAAICGVSVRTVDTIKKECKGGIPVSSRENIRQPFPVTALDDYDKSVIKQIVSSFYYKGENPTISKVLNEAKDRIDGFKCSVSSMRKILIELGYKYIVAADGRAKLMERNDVVCARLQFLRKIQALKDSQDIRPRVYLDETWLNQNHSRKRVWLDKDGEGGLKNKNGKGGRLIVCHAGCAKYGFLPNAKWIFRAMKSKIEDYHTEINAEGFTKWFRTMLLSLREPSVIIMDNASYHSQQINQAPTATSSKNEIKEWLRESKIDFCETDLKPELLKKVQQNRPKKCYYLDQLALECGHEVIRLPQYHCHYNPIASVWAQVKAEVATKNNTSKIADVEKLIHEAISHVTKEDWSKCFKFAEDLQNEDFSKAHLCEDFVIHVDEDSNDESDVDL